MPAEKTLSVVIPNYNDSQYLSVQLEAVCQQSFAPLEVIVVDDGSTDDSVRIIEEMSVKYPFIRLLKNEKNLGIIASINRGAQEACGDYIYFSSANDLVLPGLFEKSMNLLEQHPEAGLCCSDVQIIDEIQEITFDHLPTNWLTSPGYLSPEKLAETTRSRNCLYAPVSSTCIIRRDLVPEEQVYMPRLESYCDWFLYQTIAFRHGCCFIPEKLAAVRVLKKSYTLSMQNNHQLCRRVLGEIIQLLSRPEYNDVCKLMIHGRSLLVFRTLIRSPLTAWNAVRLLYWKNNQARAVFSHLTFEYVRQVGVRTAKLFSDPAAWTALQQSLSQQFSTSRKEAGQV